MRLIFNEYNFNIPCTTFVCCCNRSQLFQAPDAENMSWSNWTTTWEAPPWRPPTPRWLSPRGLDWSLETLNPKSPRFHIVSSWPQEHFQRFLFQERQHVAYYLVLESWKQCGQVWRLWHCHFCPSLRDENRILCFSLHTALWLTETKSFLYICAFEFLFYFLTMV